MYKFDYESMGTKWEISIWDNQGFPSGNCTEGNLWLLREEIIQESTKFDELYSRFKPNSLVSKISTRAGLYEVPEDFLKMLGLYFELYEPSEKKLNPLIGFTISDLGYDANYSLQEKETVRKVPDLLETVKIIDNGPTSPRLRGVKKIKVKEPVLFDFGALGKGYFVDKIATLLKEKGFKHFLVNGSGDIYYFGEEEASFGLEDPDDSSKVIGKLEIGKEDELRAFCASGTNRRKWPRLRKASDGQAGKNKELNHELDATTLEPAEFIKAVWVQAETTALGDALATCLFFSPPENFSDYAFEYLIMNKERGVKYSPNFKAEIY